MQFLTAALTTSLIVFIVGCATVRQQDLDSWVEMPVKALDTHSYFRTVRMYRTVTGSGIEIRNYVDGRESDVAHCWRNSGGGKSGRYVSKFTTCSDRRIVCNNIFYIKDGKVIEYAPAGRCVTNGRVQPQARHLRLIGQ